jgi:hypothetical protein
MPIAPGFSVLTLLVILLDEGVLTNHFIDVPCCPPSRSDLSWWRGTGARPLDP